MTVLRCSEILQGKGFREEQSTFISMLHKHKYDITLVQENSRKKSLASYHVELMSSCHVRHAGQAGTCKGVSLRNRNEPDRIH